MTVALLMADHHAELDHAQDRYHQGAADHMGDLTIPAGLFRRLTVCALLGCEGVASIEERHAISVAVSLLDRAGVPVDVDALNPGFAG